MAGGEDFNVYIFIAIQFIGTVWRRMHQMEELKHINHVQERTMSDCIQSRRTQVGFTLVELLVVIGIIALLISILLPSLGKARESANSVACMANMRSLGQAMALYQVDNKGSFAPISQMNTNITPDANGIYSYGVSNTYRGFNLWALLRVAKGSKNAAVCPTVASDLPFASTASANRLWYSYRYNYLLAGAEGSKFDVPHPSLMSGGTLIAGNPMKRVANASETMMFMDYPQTVIVQPDDQAGSDRGTQWIRATSEKYTDPVLGRQIVVVVTVAPIHGGVKPAQNVTYPTLTDAGVAQIAMQGYVNVAYCDGSVRGVFVKQGQIPASVTGGKTLTQRTQMDLSEGTTNGAIRGGGAAALTGTRIHPNIAP